MNDNDVSTKRLIKSLRICLFCLAAFFLTATAFSQPSLAIKFNPTVAITGLPGSMQQVQYTTDLANSNSWATIGFAMVTANPTYFTDTGANGESRFYRTITVGLPDTNLVWLPPATFVIGSPVTEADRSTNEGPQTTVTLTQGFFIGRYEVRNADYIQIMGSLPVESDASLTNYLLRAVRGVRWYEATNYCALRTAAELQQGRIPVGFAYRLPTEAEWEYACRAGTTTVFAFGNQLLSDSVLGVQAIFKGTFPYPTGVFSPSPATFSYPQPVGTCAPNASGLFDLHGNVGEWCLDSYNSNSPGPYPGGSVTNFISTAGFLYKIIRGGGYSNPAKDCRSAARQVASSISPDTLVGFRVVLAPVNN